MTTIQVQIQGTQPLLQHRFSEDAEAAQSTRKQLIKSETPREAAQKVAYIAPDGTHYFPGAAISRAIREAGSNHKSRGSRKSLKFVVPSALRVPHDTIQLVNGDGKTPIRDFEVDSRPVVIPSTKGRVMRHRPRHDKWGAIFTLCIDETILPLDVIHQLLTEAGTQLGIGDFRPEKGGPFGTFQIVLWKQI